MFIVASVDAMFMFTSMNWCLRN